MRTISVLLAILLIAALSEGATQTREKVAGTVSQTESKPPSTRQDGSTTAPGSPPKKVQQRNDAEVPKQPAPTQVPMVATNGKAEHASAEKPPLTPATANVARVNPINDRAVPVASTKPARILVVLPAPAYSHTINYMPIFKELASRGHQITMVSPFPQKAPLPNWEDITVENVLQKMLSSTPNKDLSKMNGFFSSLTGALFFGFSMMDMLYDMKPLQDLLADRSRKYDLVFVEAYFVQEPLLAFGHKYGAPVISIVPCSLTPELAYYTGNPVLTSTYFPNMALPFSNRMSFIERAKNMAFTILKVMMYNLIYLPKMDAVMRERWPATRDSPPLSDMLFNVSLTLLDGNPALNYPYPKHRNVIEFLGVNTKDTSLTPELQELLDGSDKDGVLFFTLGSHLRLSTLRPEIRSALMYAFSKIPQKVLMKWDSDTPPDNLPPNVQIAKWFPQAAILRHKNVRAFLTHSGIHGLMEAMHHGVPVISMPVFADQYYFAKWAEENGAGKPIYIDTITPESALSTITEVINNPKYKEGAQTISQLLDDVPTPTLSEVVFWVEHVLRTKGARHLRPGSLNLAWYQRFGLDLLAAAVAVLVLTLWVLKLTLKLTFRCLLSLCRRKSSKKEQEKERSKSKSKKQD